MSISSSWVLTLLLLSSVLGLLYYIAHYHPTKEHFQDDSVTPIAGLRSQEEQLAFCQTLGQAISICEQNKNHIECKQFDSSVKKMKDQLNVLLEINNNRNRTKYDD